MLEIIWSEADLTRPRKNILYSAATAEAEQMFLPCTGRSNWILHRKWKYSTYCLRDVILDIE